MSRLIRSTVAAAIALALAGCGASSPSSSTAATARSLLRDDVLALSRAAAARDATAAATALDNLDADLAAVRAGGQLSPTQVAQIRAAADAVRADLATLATPTPTATPTSTPKPTKTKHHGNDDPKGKGAGG
jgi:hypothetical protein